MVESEVSASAGIVELGQVSESAVEVGLRSEVVLHQLAECLERLPFADLDLDG